MAGSLHRSLTTTLAVLVLAATVGVTACGSDETDSEADYVTKLDAIATSATQGVEDLVAKVRSADFSLTGISGVLSTFSDRVDGLAARVEALNPPEEVAKLQARLVKLMKSLAGKTRSLSAALGSGDPVAALGLPGLASDAVDLGKRIEETIRNIGMQLNPAA